MEIGKIYPDGYLSDGNGEWHQVPFRVLKETTFEEYQKYCQENSENPIGYISLNDTFYEVSID